VIKVHPRVLLIIDSIFLITFFGSIIATNLGIISYSMNRVITNLSLLGIISILWISVILYRKGLIKEIPFKEDKKYLMIGILIGSTLSAITFLSIIL